MMSYKILFLVFFVMTSCQSQEAKKEVKKESGLFSVTCNLISLKGVDEIYKITENVLRVKGRQDKMIAEKELEELKNIPKAVSVKNGKYGCGVCTDGVDYKFIFNFKDGKTTTWEIEPGVEIPAEVEAYFKVLVENTTKVLQYK